MVFRDEVPGPNFPFADHPPGGASMERETNQSPADGDGGRDHAPTDVMRRVASSSGIL
jgi:hypothetical protein